MDLRRTVLIVPALQPILAAKAAATKTDVLWLELEDGVQKSRKEEARRLAVEQLTTIDWGDKVVLVRVNPMSSEDGPEDIRTVAAAGPHGVLLAKVRHVDEILEADRILAEVEAETGKHVKIWCMIESAPALANVDAIASCCDRMDGLVLGAGDLSCDLRVKRVGLGGDRVLPPMQGLQVELIYPRGRVVTAARANGLTAIDIGYNTKTDAAATYLHALYSFQFGFDGNLVISPRMIEPVQRAWAPTEADLEWARRIVALRDRLADENSTVGLLDDELVDGPFFISAQRLLEREAAALERA
jgi:citrate lyase subunit beta / citryl-CoA lyase